MQHDPDLVGNAASTRAIKGVWEVAGVRRHILEGLLQALLCVLGCLLYLRVLLAGIGEACHRERTISSAVTVPTSCSRAKTCPHKALTVHSLRWQLGSYTAVHSCPSCEGQFQTQRKVLTGPANLVSLILGVLSEAQLLLQGVTCTGVST